MPLRFRGALEAGRCTYDLSLFYPSNHQCTSKIGRKKDGMIVRWDFLYLYIASYISLSLLSIHLYIGRNKTNREPLFGKEERVVVEICVLSVCLSQSESS